MDQIIKLKLEHRELVLQHYFTREAFGLIWWAGIACMVIIPFIWWMLADKKRLIELCVYGLATIVCATFLDVVGSEMALWQYRINIVLPISILMPVDFVIVPAINMFIYQKCPKWGKYMVACAVTATLLSFGLEPFAVYIGEYKIISWRFFYSPPIYLAINASAKFITEKLKEKQLFPLKPTT